MNKKITAMTIAACLTASVGFAAPMTDIQEGKTTIGYNYTNMDTGTALGNASSNALHAEAGLTNRLAVGIERENIKKDALDLSLTDVGFRYKMDNNVYLMAGNRNYDGNGVSTDKFYYGIGASTPLAERVDGYASVIKNSEETNWQLGIDYKMTSNTSLEMTYKHHSFDGGSMKGLGFGVAYSF